MAYQPYYYNPYYQPETKSQGITWVQGEEAAKAYLVAAGNSVVLMDADSSTFYIKSTDASGMPLPLRVFDYSERRKDDKNEKYVTRAEFEAFIARLKEGSNVQSDSNAANNATV